MRLTIAIAAGLTLGGASGAAAVITITMEAPGVDRPTAAARAGVQDFETVALGRAAFDGRFGDTGVLGRFTGLRVERANQYGGAGGGGRFATVLDTATLTLSRPADRFGLWASALDGGNAVLLYAGDAALGTVRLTGLAFDRDYFGNPDAPFAGRNAREPYAFINLLPERPFDRVVFSRNGGGGFELDNVTVGLVPEATTWAMMIAGFGLVGYAARKRRAGAPRVA